MNLIGKLFGGETGKAKIEEMIKLLKEELAKIYRDEREEEQKKKSEKMKISFFMPTQKEAKSFTSESMDKRFRAIVAGYPRDARDKLQEAFNADLVAYIVN